ncbi:hypothetical protein CR513_32659, partial [Mucuna pruriens]
MFIDDYFTYDYLYLIHKKSQSLDVFKSFKAKVELQLGNKIKIMRTMSKAFCPFSQRVRNCSVIHYARQT